MLMTRIGSGYKAIDRDKINRRFEDGSIRISSYPLLIKADQANLKMWWPRGTEVRFTKVGV